MWGRCFVNSFRSILPEVLPRDHSESRISQSFSQVMFELLVVSFNEGDSPVVFQAYREGIFPLRLHPLQAPRDVRNQTGCVVCRPIVLVLGPRFPPLLPPLFLSQQHVPGHRYRLIARSLHWVNRMPPDQGGQQYLFASPSLVFPHRPGDCRSQRGTSLFPCISTFNCVMPVNITKCSLCSKVKILLIVPILLVVVVAFAALSFWTSRFLCFPCDSWYLTCFLTRDILQFLSRRNFLDVFLLTHQRRCNGRLLGVELVTNLFVKLLCVLDCFLKDFELLRPHSIQSPVVNHRGDLDFWYLPIHSIHPQARDTCNRDQTETASLDDSIHCLPHFTTRLSLAKESLQVEHEGGLQLPNTFRDSHLHHHGEDHLPHDHVEKFGRINRRCGHSFFFTFHCQQHSPHTRSWIRFSGMPPATDLGNHVLHLMTPMKRVPAQRL